MTLSVLPQRYRDYVARNLSTRIPAIIRSTAAGLTAESAEALATLHDEVVSGLAMQLELAGWEPAGWEGLPGRVNGLRPAEAPFFDFEHWLYHRILSAVRFAETSHDPFHATKHRDLARHLRWASEALVSVRDLSAALALSLEANAHDLSQLAGPAAGYDLRGEALDIDRSGLRRLNLIADNFGAEFVADLVLAIVAAESGVEVVVHVKPLPMFVSDTTWADVVILLDRLGGDEFGRRLRSAHEAGSIRFEAHDFWSAPLFLDEVPLAALGDPEGALNVLKGDLNFRRAVGDAVVPVRTPFEQLPVLPAAPMLSLRSIKSYCAAGMHSWPEGMSEETFPTDGSIVTVQELPGRATVSA